MKNYNLFSIKFETYRRFQLNFKNYYSALFFFRKLAENLKYNKDLSNSVECCFCTTLNLGLHKRVPQRTTMNDKILIETGCYNDLSWLYRFFPDYYIVIQSVTKDKDFALIITTIIDLSNKFNYLSMSFLGGKYYLTQYVLNKERESGFSEEIVREIREKI